MAAAPEVATLDVPGPGGTFSVPYIQSRPDLLVRLKIDGYSDLLNTELVLDEGTPGEIRQEMVGPDPSATLQLGWGEHNLTARVWMPREGTPAGELRSERPVATARLSHVARGDIIAAMGDSTTEGLGDGPFSSDELGNLLAFPNWVVAREHASAVGANWVSGDGRNYPQAVYALPGRSRPSFTADLGNILELTVGHPVLVLNLGFSGSTSEAYIQVVESETVRREFAVATPNIYLLNLGVNDALVHRSAGDYLQRMDTIVADLATRFGAGAGAIHIACPNWAKQPQRHDLESTYLPALNALRDNNHLAAGPDFFSFFRDHPEYLADQVHPNAEGYLAMAVLWSEAVRGSGSVCQAPRAGG
ncbi:MAG: SGNH/GDSL hydrolase family protein [Candidatus Dormibacteria bacterium]